MKKRDSEVRLFRQIRENNFDDGRSFGGEPTACVLCCCNSCTGFACPWIKSNKKHIPDWLNRSDIPRRCSLCYMNADFKHIYDCDFYTYYKRKRYFIPRKLKRGKNKIDKAIEKLDNILKLLENRGE